MGIVNTPEPYAKRSAQGMILGSDGDKMSKSKGNVVDPLDIVNEYGADALRTYVLFMGDYGAAAPWNDSSVRGCKRFLERVANSQYKDNFIIKGGMLVTAMVGVALRSTMDIDTSIKNQNLSAEDARRIVDEIKDIDLGDGVTFEVKEVSNIMDEMEYPGIRFTMNAVMGKLVTPMKIDISTGDVITQEQSSTTINCSWMTVASAFGRIIWKPFWQKNFRRSLQEVF